MRILATIYGVPGTYIKSFLISDKINLNDLQATHEANISNLDTFLGRPGIHYINEEGKRDHTSATSFEKSLQIQELYRAASIIAVDSDIIIENVSDKNNDLTQTLSALTFYYYSLFRFILRNHKGT